MYYYSSITVFVIFAIIDFTHHKIVPTNPLLYRGGHPATIGKTVLINKKSTFLQVILFLKSCYFFSVVALEEKTLQTLHITLILMPRGLPTHFGDYKWTHVMLRTP